jgi:hypothetical protein
MMQYSSDSIKLKKPLWLGLLSVGSGKHFIRESSEDYFSITGTLPLLVQ